MIHGVTQQYRWGMLVLAMCLAFAALPSSANVANTSEKELNFKVWVDDREIGSHAVTISEQTNAAKERRTSIFTKVKLKVKLMFVNIFSYNHQAKETWDGHCLESLETKTKDNGKHYYLKGNREADDRFMLKREMPKNKSLNDEHPACMGTYAYWDLDRIQRDSLINTQTGEVSEASLVEEGMQPIPKIGKEAMSYRLVTDNPVIRLWYSDQGDWLALQTDTDGRTLTYLNEALLDQ